MSSTLPKEIIDKIEAEAEKLFPVHFDSEEGYWNHSKKKGYIAAALHYSQITEQKDAVIEQRNNECVRNFHEIEQLKAENERLKEEVNEYSRNLKNASERATRSLLLLEALEWIKDNIWYSPSENIIKQIDSAIASYNNNKP